MKSLTLLAILLIGNVFAHADDNVTEDIRFSSHGVDLAGSIVFPTSGIKAAIVFVHGSGPAERPTYWAARFAADGIAALVYDKRGVGASGGEYEQNQNVSEKNLRLLADDAVAALRTLRAHLKMAGVKIGLADISQAGWIVPLAAEKDQRIDFLVLWSGPVTRVSEEDIFSKYTRDRDEERVPSYREALDARRTPYIWPDFLGQDTNPADSLVQLHIPGLWVFGERDGSVPVDLSIERLRPLIDMGKPYEYALISSLGHNNMNETFSYVSDWIKRAVR